jgi:ABC-type polysaccharide/polyol phosphate transport system ATPase subunit
MEKNRYSIIAKNITKGYKMYSSPKEKLLDLILPKGAGKNFYALKDISFEIEKGEIVGLLGLNGSGKSTLSNILGGVSMPTSGEIEINGEASLIAIGIGMNNFLTGIENIELKALMMGYKKEEIEEIKQEIIDFADIGEFINQPLRTYSSGMRARLGFAISVYTNPDILVIDEALSVGDPTFTQKCLDKMNEFKEKRKTIFFVSHSLPQIKQFCNKAIWLEYGRLREYGNVEDVLPKYKKYIDEINKMSEKERAEYKKTVLRNQEHSLLRDFKLVDNSLKKFKLNGKVIKTVTLINDKKNIEEVFYNMDLSTFAFGFIPSIMRKRYESAFFILICQILNFFIIGFPFSIFTNFTVTGIASIFTSKEYLDYLIEKKKFIPYNIWENIHGKEDIELKKKILEKKKANKLVTISSIILITFSSVFSSLYVMKEFNLISYKKIVVKDYMLILVSNENNKQTIDSLLLLNSNDSEGLDGVVYPGEIQVSLNNTTDTLSKLANVENIEELKEILKNNFNAEASEYIILNKEDIKSTNAEDTELYKDILSNILTLGQKEFNKKVDDVIERYPNINEDLLINFYKTFNNEPIDIAEINYKTVLLSDIIEEEILIALDMLDKGDYKFITTNPSILQNNAIIKDINTKYDELLNSYYEENIEVYTPEIEDESYEADEGTWNNQGGESTQESNNGNVGGGTTTPSNNENVGGGTTTPSNNENVGGGTTPPSNNGNVGGGTTSPSDNGSIGEGTTPPSDNGNEEVETTPPSDNGSAGVETTTPSDNESIGGETTEENNNGNIVDETVQ